MFILTTWRNEGDLSRLTNLLAESRRAGRATKITLTRLTRDEVEKLVASVEALPADHLQTLFDETEGLPYFVVEYLTAARQGNDWTQLTGIQDLQRARIAGLDETARQILTTASVIGRSFDFDTLRTVSGRSEDETITGLEALISRGLLVEHKDSAFIPHPSSLSYDFTHEKIRTVVYGDLTLTRRRILHRRVAETLQLRNRTSGEAAARLAFHFQQAGQETQAAKYYFIAGEHARRLYANAEALAHFQAALALGYPDPAALHEAMGDLQTLQGEYRAAASSFQFAAALAAGASLARLERKLGSLYHRWGDYDLAASFFQSALENAAQPAERAKILADWSQTCARQGDYARAEELAQEALALAGQGDDPISTGQVHNVLGMLACRAGDLARAAGHLQEALRIARRQEHLPAEVAALNNLALVYGDQGEYARAVQLAQGALALCTRLGDRHRQAALHNRLADLFHASDQPASAMEHLKRAVEIFADIGGKAGEYEPEIWKLTEW